MWLPEKNYRRALPPPSAHLIPPFYRLLMPQRRTNPSSLRSPSHSSHIRSSKSRSSRHARRHDTSNLSQPSSDAQRRDTSRPSQPSSDAQRNDTSSPSLSADDFVITSSQIENLAALKDILNAYRPEAFTSSSTPGSEELDGSKRPTKRM